MTAVDNNAILDMRQVLVEHYRRRRRSILSELADIDAALRTLTPEPTKADKEKASYDGRLQSRATD